VLATIRESFQSFPNNYLASLLGHVPTVCTLLAAQDADMREDSFTIFDLLQVRVRLFTTCSCVSVFVYV